MNATSDPGNRAIFISVFVALIGVGTAVAVILLDIDIDSSGGALFFIGAVIAFAGFIAAISSASRARARAALMQPGNLLAHWTYGEDEWAGFWNAEFLRRRKENKKYLVLVGVIVLLVLLAFVLNDVSIIVPAAVLILLMSTLTIIVFLQPWHQLRTSRMTSREAYIGKTGLIINRTFHKWTGFSTRFESVGIREGEPPYIEFTYSIRTRNGRTKYIARVPIPYGQRQSVNRLIEELPALEKASVPDIGGVSYIQKRPVNAMASITAGAPPAIQSTVIDDDALSGSKRRRGCRPIFIVAILLMIAAAAAAYLYISMLNETQGSIVLGSHDEVVYELLFSPDGTLLASDAARQIWSEHPDVAIWSMADNKQAFTIPYLFTSTNHMAWSPDSRVFALSCPDYLALYDARLGSKTAEIELTVPGETRLVFSQDGRRLLRVADSLSYYDVSDSGLIPFALPTPDLAELDVVLADSHQVVVAGLASDTLVIERFYPDAGPLRVVVPEVAEYMNEVMSFALSDDGRLCIIHLPGTLLAYGTVDCARLAKINVSRHAIGFQLSHDGTRVLVYGDEASNTPTVRVYEISSGKLQAEVIGEDCVPGAFSRDGSMFVSHKLGSSEFTVRETNGGRMIIQVHHRDGFFPDATKGYATAISPDNRHLLTARKTIRIWELVSGI